MKKLYHLFHSLFLSSPALEDYAAMKRTFRYRLDQINASLTPQDFAIVSAHINADAARFRATIDAGIVNGKVQYLLDAIDARTTQLFSPVFDDMFLN